MKSILSNELIAGIIGLIILSQAIGVGTRTITVNDSGGADYTSIQMAINNARAGDTILVYSGTYQEKVVVNKPLILKGIDNGGGKPVVKAATKERLGEIPIALSSGSVTLDGFRTESGSSGIYIISKNNMIINNTALDNRVGIFLESSSNNILNNNSVLNNEFGIFLDNTSNNNYLDGNIVSKNDYGIDVYSSNNTLSGNNVSSNILLGFFLGGEVSNNTIYNNLFNNNENFRTWGMDVNRWNITKAQGINIAGGPNLGGNFWATPRGTGFSQICADNDLDGICDSPYDFHDPFNIDYLPLAFMPTATKMTLTVDDTGGADYKKVQDAINNARAGATILVYSGIYDEEIIINKQLILKGIDNGWGRPIIKSITLRAGNGTFDGFKTIGRPGIYVNSANNIISNNTMLNGWGISLEDSGNNIIKNNIAINTDHDISITYSNNFDQLPLAYKPITKRLINLGLIILTLGTIVMVYLKKEKIRAEIARASVNAAKSAIKDLIIGSIQGIFVGFIAGAVISQIMVYLGFFAEDPGFVIGASMFFGAGLGAIVGAIAGIIKDVNISALAGAISSVVFLFLLKWTTIEEIGVAIGVVFLGGLLGRVIGRAVFNDNRKSSMNGAIIGGVIGFGGLGSIFTGIIIGSLIGGVLGLLAGRITVNKKAIPMGVASGLIGSAIAGVITGIFFQVEALYISFIVGLVAGAIIGGTIFLYSGAGKHAILNAVIGGMIAGSAAGLMGGSIVIDWILITNQNINEGVFISGSIGAVVGGISGVLQTRKNVLFESAVAGSISALIGLIAEDTFGYHFYVVPVNPIVITIAGAIIGGIMNRYSRTRKYTILLAILGGVIVGIILGIIG